MKLQFIASVAAVLLNSGHGVFAAKHEPKGLRGSLEFLEYPFCGECYNQCCDYAGEDQVLLGSLEFHKRDGDDYEGGRARGRGRGRARGGGVDCDGKCQSKCGEDFCDTYDGGYEGDSEDFDLEDKDVDLLEYQCDPDCLEQFAAEGQEIDLLAYHACCGGGDGNDPDGGRGGGRGRGRGGNPHCYDCCEDSAGEDQVLLGLGYCNVKACQRVFDEAGGKDQFCQGFDGGEGGEGGEGGQGVQGGDDDETGGDDDDAGGNGGFPGEPGSAGGPPANPGFNPMGGRGGGGGGPRAACQSIPVQAGCFGNPFCTWSGGQCVPAMAAANDIEGDSEDFDLEEE